LKNGWVDRSLEGSKMAVHTSGRCPRLFKGCFMFGNSWHKGKKKKKKKAGKGKALGGWEGDVQ